MDRPRDPTMPQSTSSQHEEASIQQSRLELQQFQHHSVPGTRSPIEQDFGPNTFRNEFGQPTQADEAYPNFQLEGTSGWLTVDYCHLTGDSCSHLEHSPIDVPSTEHYDILVGDLDDKVTDETLFSLFSAHPTCLGARVMKDNFTCCSIGYGYVTFWNQQDAQRAINDLNGKLLGSRRIRCNWVTIGPGAYEGQHSFDENRVVVFSNGSSENVQQMSSSEDPENDPRITSVFVGYLRPQVTYRVLFWFFHSLGAGEIINVRVLSGKDYGFVQYRTHSEAARAIQMGNDRLARFPTRCAWARKPDTADTTQNPISLLIPLPPVYDQQLLISLIGGANEMQPIPLPCRRGSCPDLLNDFRRPLQPISPPTSHPRLSGYGLRINDGQRLLSRMGGANSMQPIGPPKAASSSASCLSGSDLRVDDRLAVVLPVSSSYPMFSDHDVLAAERLLQSSPMGCADSLVQPIRLYMAASASDPCLSGSDIQADNHQALPSPMGGDIWLMQPQEQLTDEQAVMEQLTQEEAAMEQRTQGQVALDQRTQEQAAMEQRAQEQVAMEKQRSENEAALEQQHTQDQEEQQQRTHDQAAMEQQGTYDQATLDQLNKEQQRTHDQFATEQQGSQDQAATEQQLSQDQADIDQLTQERADLEQRAQERTEDEAALEQQCTHDQAEKQQGTHDQAAMVQQHTQDQAALEQQDTQDRADMEQQRSQDQAAMEQRQRTQDHAAMEQQVNQDDAAREQQGIHDQADLDQLTKDQTVLEQQGSQDQAAMEKQLTLDQAALDQLTQDQAAMELQPTHDQAAQATYDVKFPALINPLPRIRRRRN